MKMCRILNIISVFHGMCLTGLCGQSVVGSNQIISTGGKLVFTASTTMDAKASQWYGSDQGQVTCELSDSLNGHKNITNVRTVLQHTHPAGNKISIYANTASTTLDLVHEKGYCFDSFHSLWLRQHSSLGSDYNYYDPCLIGQAATANDLLVRGPIHNWRYRATPSVNNLTRSNNQFIGRMRTWRSETRLMLNDTIRDVGSAETINVISRYVPEPPEDARLEFTLNGPGMIDVHENYCMYIAPNEVVKNSQEITISATNVSNSDITDTVSIWLRPVGICIKAESLPTGPIGAGTTHQFKPYLVFSANKEFVCELEGPGSVSKDGLYTAPSAVTGLTKATVRVKSVYDPTITRDFKVTIKP